jgi:beta-glucosidase-like glycosyl hydrolase
MQGVQKFFPGGEASVQSIIAGNDMLCLPVDVEQTINKIKDAVNKKLLTWDDINYHCKKVLLAKYQYVGEKITAVSTDSLAADLNKGIPEMRRLVAENAITLLNKKDNSFFPLVKGDSGEIAFIGIGINTENDFAKRLKTDFNADIFLFNDKQKSETMYSLMTQLKKYNQVIIGLHNYNRKPENNFGLPAAAIDLVNQLQDKTNSITFIFGNPYAIKNFCNAPNLVTCYEDDAIVQNAAADFLQGKFPAKGKLPVTVCDKYKFGSGITTGFFLPQTKTDSAASIH